MKIICPRCKYEFDMDEPPSLGWICNFCCEELGIKLDDNIFAQSPRNEMENRQLDEDYDGEVENKIEAKRKEKE